ncbi:response regulator [Skermanella pratensis]|uniref:response regulator n=1 Tax=Skermanella pratensis TaxID=2233999 RepID=UPI0017886421|nr:response regulator [Skermanella pratensis]
MRILIVEDDPLVALALRLYLTELGHTVVSTAADTNRVLQLADDGLEADLALVDLHLARGSCGIEAAVQLRYLSGIASVFLTSDAEGAHTARHAAIGCLIKPICGSRLAAALTALDTFVQGRIPHHIPDGLEVFPAAMSAACSTPLHRDGQSN